MLLWFNWKTQTATKFAVSELTTLHTFNVPLSRTTRVSRYQKGKTNLDFTEARDSEWQWHQLGHMQVCTWLQADNHASTPPLSFYRPDALPAAQPTASKHWRHSIWAKINGLSRMWHDAITDTHWSTPKSLSCQLLCWWYGMICQWPRGIHW